MQNLDDEDLLARYRADRERGESGSRWVNELFGRYHARVATWCYRFTGDRDSAGDLAQEIFLRTYRNLDSFQGSARFSTWLYTVTRNHCVNEMRSRQSRFQDAAESLDFEVADAAASALDSLQQQESLQQMRSLIEENLDPLEKQVMVMHFASGISLGAVSRLLGLTNASGARAYIVSAKRKLARARDRWRTGADSSKQENP